MITSRMFRPGRKFLVGCHQTKYDASLADAIIDSKNVSFAVFLSRQQNAIL